MPHHSSVKPTESLDFDGIRFPSSAFDHDRLPVPATLRKRQRSRKSSFDTSRTQDSEKSSPKSFVPLQKKSRSVIPSLQKPSGRGHQRSECQDGLGLHTQFKDWQHHYPEIRRRALSETPALPSNVLSFRRSAPEMRRASGQEPNAVYSFPHPVANSDPLVWTSPAGESLALYSSHSPHLSDPGSISHTSGSVLEGLDNPDLRKELDARWILNLSLAFRDKANQEKFFVTYAEQPNRWRRITVSCDYSNAPQDSLEADLKSLRYQRDKSAHIYEAIRESLSTVQFYDTVTNLKLQTADNQLHVHVTEDIDEIISYPPVAAVQHLHLAGCEQITEDSIHFVSHISGCVYQVDAGGETYIKKEIPGPDMVDEFLYEVNALYKLRNSVNVIDFRAIVLDTSRKKIKGLLISFARRGALVDLIYDHRTSPLSWPRRDKWIRQIVAGLSDIHEAGFVQGDFTLSNIVIDDSDDAKIIDINRRGCPVGWEPPEFLGLIASGQRISMYIGTKSDLYQLGMVLWALSVPDDEPERAESPLSVEDAMRAGAPQYMRQWITSCLADDPSQRRSTNDLLTDLIDQEQTRADEKTWARDLKISYAHRAHGLTADDFAFLTDVPLQLSQARDDTGPELDDGNSGHSHHLSDSDGKSARLRARQSAALDVASPLICRSSISGKQTVEEPESLHALNDPSQTRMLSATQQKYKSTSQRNPLSPPLHQDSGFGPGEEEGTTGFGDMIPTRSSARTYVPAERGLDHEHGSLKTTRTQFSPPVHQDSGFGESALSKAQPPPNGRASGMPRAVTTDEFAGIGAAHVEHNEDRSIYVI